MKTIRKNFGLKMFFFLIVIGGITACDVNDNVDNGPQYVYVATTGVTGPATAAINQEVTFNVSFKVDNNCGTFHSFYEEGSVTERTITVLAQYYGDCSVDPIPATRTAPYIFKSSTAGTFVLKFRVNNDGNSASFITQTIVVS